MNALSPASTPAVRGLTAFEHSPRRSKSTADSDLEHIGGSQSTCQSDSRQSNFGRQASIRRWQMTGLGGENWWQLDLRVENRRTS